MAAAPPKTLRLRVRPAIALALLPDPVARRLEQAPWTIVLATAASIVGVPVFAAITARAGGPILTSSANSGPHRDPGLVPVLWECPGVGLVTVWAGAVGPWKTRPRSVRVTELAALLVFAAAA